MSSQVAKKVERFFSNYPVKQYDKGEILILADENPKFIYHIIEGHVREYDISHRGDEIVVNVFKSPAFFPVSWAIAKTPNRYFFEAGSKISVRQAPSVDVLDFIKANPDVMLDLLTRLYSGLDGMRRRMAHLMGGGAKSRLLLELIIECRRFGKHREDGSYLIRMDEGEIGARAGLSRETVSREIHELKELNLISVDRQGIVLKDIDALEKKLGPNL